MDVYTTECVVSYRESLVEVVQDDLYTMLDELVGGGQEWIPTEVQALVVKKWARSLVERYGG